MKAKPKQSDRLRLRLRLKIILKEVYPFYSDSFYKDKARGIAEVLIKLGYKQLCKLEKRD
jgi:hypothetical protein